MCNRPTNTCVICRSPADCDNGLVCTGGACVAATACTSDLDCTPGGKVCDTSGGRCVQCKGSAECPSGQACLGFACTPVISCMSSLDCTARKQVCAPATPPRFPATIPQACQDCASNNDCPLGNECQSGVCIDACGARVCGSVNGVDCGICPLAGPLGSSTCLEPGRACRTVVASSPGGSSGESAVFASGALMWTERFSGGSVYALNLSTGVAEQVSVNEDYPEGVGATATNYYWGAAGGVYQRARSGGNRSLAAAFTAGTERCISLAIAPGQIYCGVYSTAVNGEGVYRAPLSGGVPMTRVVTEPYPSVLTHGQNVFFVGADRLGFHDALAGTTTSLLTHNGFVSAPIFADDTSVFFWRTDPNPVVLRRLVLATRMETTLYTGSFGEALNGGASDGTYAYVLISTGSSLRLLKVTLATGATITLADDLAIGSSPGQVAMQLEATGLLIGFPGYVLRIAPR